VVCTKQTNGLTSYAIRITAYGQRQFVTLGTEEDGWTPARAELERQRIAEAVKAGVWQPPQPRSQPAADTKAEPDVAPTFQEVATSFVRRKSLILAPTTIKDLRWRLTDHLLPYFAAMRIDEIGNDAFFGYLESKLQQRDRIREAQAAGRPLVDGRGIPLRPLSNTSINMTLATLAAVLDEPECEPWVTRNPARGK